MLRDTFWDFVKLSPANNSPADTELSKTYISKMKQLGGFFGDLAVDLLQVAFRTGIEAGKRGASILAKCKKLFCR